MNEALSYRAEIVGFGVERPDLGAIRVGDGQDVATGECREREKREECSERLLGFGFG